MGGDGRLSQRRKAPGWRTVVRVPDTILASKHDDRALRTAMHGIDEKGTNVNTSEPSTKNQSPRTGLFASARAVLRGAGSGTPLAHVPLAAIVLVGLFASGSLAPSSASAAFTRPFLCQLTTVSAPEALAVNKEGDAWVSETLTPPHSGEPLVGKLYEFGPVTDGACGGFLGPLGGTAPIEIAPYDELQSMSIELASGRFYLAGAFYQTGSMSFSSAGPVEVFESTGLRSELWKNHDQFASTGQPVDVAVDSSTAADDPSGCGLSPLSPGECFVYVAHNHIDDGAPTGDGLSAGIEKFDGKGEPVAFSAAGEVGYVVGNEITGTPMGGFSQQGFGAVTIDGSGDLFAGDERVVDEWEPSGRFAHQFSLASAPPIIARGGFERVTGVAVDEASGHLLVTVVSKDGQPPTPFIYRSAIDEFNIASGQFLDQMTGAGPGEGLAQLRSVATDSAGDVFAVDSGDHVVDVWGAGHFDPDVVLGEATHSTPGSAVLNGSVDPLSGENPEHGALTACHFQYVPEATFEHNVEAHGESQGFAELGMDGGESECVPGPAGIEANDTSQPVHADVADLRSGVTYRYRLVATTDPTKEGGTSETAPLTFTAPDKPEILSASAGDLSSRFADLEATIDPLGADTAYHFEYLTEAGFAANESSWAGPDTATSVPVPDGSIGAGGASGRASESVRQQVGGLQPDTVYEFRLVASNAVGTTYGETLAFATLATPLLGLPDGRAYELVTPANKGSAEDLFGEPIVNGEFYNAHDDGMVSESGDQFLEETKAALGGFPASGFGVYAFARTPAGWTTTSLASPSLGVQSLNGVTLGVGEVLAGTLVEPFDLSRVAVNDRVGSEVSTARGRMVNLTGPAGGPYVTLHESLPVGSVGEAAEPAGVAGASHDLSHLVFESRDRGLCAGGEAQVAGSGLLCEYSDGQLRLVNVNSKGAAVSACGAVLGGGSVHASTMHNAVSGDGSRVFFTAPDPTAENQGEGCWNGKTTNAPQLYMRADSSTVEVSKPEKGAAESNGHYLAEYAGASEDGSRVFFTSEGELTRDDSGGIKDHELYEYDVQSGKLTRISHGQSGKAVGDVLRVVAVSSEGSAVYFMAGGVLASNRGADGTSASLSNCETGGEIPTCNLYRYDTVTATTTFIATLNATDMQPEESGVGQNRGPSAAADEYASSAGDYFAFASSRELTGYSTLRASPDDCDRYPNSPGGGNGHCTEIYRYHYEPGAASGGSLLCASCNPTGALPVSNARFARSAAINPGSGPVRAMSNDGSYVFFDTADALVSNDSNKTLDVYEWHEGEVALLSSGKDPAPSYFLGASPDGSNVFIGTHAKLVPQDTDDQGDIYDARICTASDPCLEPPVGETAQCEGSSCQHAPAQPVEATPASLVFTGAGSLVSELALITNAKVAPKVVRCKKGLVKKKIKKKEECVKAKAKSKDKGKAQKAVHRKGSH